MFVAPRSRGLLAATFVLSLVAAPILAAGPEATVDDLSWMTGSWKGALGPGTLEETWNRPDAGSIAALVRGTGGGALNMIELIVIEETEGSLVLRLQQWNPGFEPRAPTAQTMELVAIEERKVSFEAVDEGSLQGLTYSRPSDDTFVIQVKTATGAELAIELSAQ